MNYVAHSPKENCLWGAARATCTCDVGLEGTKRRGEGDTEMVQTGWWEWKPLGNLRCYQIGMNMEYLKDYCFHVPGHTFTFEENVWLKLEILFKPSDFKCINLGS